MAIARSSIWAFALAPVAVLSQGLRQPNPSATGPIVQWYPTPSPEVSTCSANILAKLCEYKEPTKGTAVASSGPKMCMEYCNSHPPCKFFIFLKGNPYTGTGTCWNYNGEDFDKSLGKEGCDTLTVYDKPDCGTAPEPTKTEEGACAATVSPEPIAQVCEYPPPPNGDCYYDCTAQTNATGCLSQCVARGEKNCKYAVFRTESGSPWLGGTCWMYREGSYDSTKGKQCSQAEHFVYKNPCPRAATQPRPGPDSEGSDSGSASTSTSPGNSTSPNPGGSGGQFAENGTKQSGAPATGGSESLVGALAVGVVGALLQRFL